jgi:hypothetical protein
MGNRSGLAALTFSLAVVPVAAFALEAETASLVLTGGRVWTGDSARPWAQAVAVRGDLILAVGTDREVVGRTDARTERVDLAGRFVMPGINDAHIHFLRGCQRLFQVDLNGADSLEEMQRRVARFAKETPPISADNPWVLGFGWQYSSLPGGRLPTRQDLDAAVPDRPVYLAAYDGHTGWANTRALQLAGVTRDTKYSGWGEIVRDPGSGEATGVFKEQAQTVVTAAIPAPTHERQREALRRGLALAASLGITSIQNAHGTPEEVELFREARDAGELTLRVGVAQTLRPPVTRKQVQDIAALAARYRDGTLRVGAVKLVVDGVIETHTAVMLAPYSDEPGTKGLPAWTQEHLNEVVSWADQAGLQIYIHAIGDGGVRMSLDAYAQARRANGAHDARYRVEHLETIDAADVPRFKELGVLASMMPIHADPGTIDVWARAAGPERTSRAFAWRMMQQAGAFLVFGSDWPSTLSVDPWRGLHCAVNRQTADGQPPGGWLPEHRVSVETALAAYTSGGAYAEFQEKQKGVLAPGMAADLVVLSANPFELVPKDLHTLRPRLTVHAGRVVYKAER